MILDRIQRSKRLFNVNSKQDIKVFKSFLQTHSWGTTGCPFAIEYPYMSIPDMIKDKLVHKYLGVKQ